MRWVLDAAKELMGLIVEDGFVALGAVIAIAAGYVLTRAAVIGPRPAVGGLIFVLLAGALLASLTRAARQARGR